MASGGPFRAVVLGGSAGATEAMVAILGGLPPGFGLEVVAVRHLHASDQGGFAGALAHSSRLPVAEARDGEAVTAGRVVTAPANYHLLVERDETLALTVDDKVNWSRPSIDVTFESCARCWGPGLVAVLLSGANHDGAAGLRWVRALGGLAIVQEPGTAPYPVMPQSAVDLGAVDETLAAADIGRRLAMLGGVAAVGDSSRAGTGARARCGTAVTAGRP